jgi:predicted RNA-binding Zn ribbon-like protein
MTASRCSSTPGLDLVRAFANTVDVDDGTDVLADGAAFAAWLTDHGVEAGGDVSPADLDLAVALRDALRDELDAHHDGGSDPDARQRLAELSQQLPLAVDTCSDGTPGLVPAGDPTPARSLLSEVLAGMAVAGFDGTWHRLKICPADDCRWAFYDQSKNRSKRWCSMESCGNRNKTREFRRRHGSDPSAPSR